MWVLNLKLILHFCAQVLALVLLLACVQNAAAARQSNLFGGQAMTGRSLITTPLDTISPISYGFPTGSYGFPGYGLPGYGGYGGLAIESALPPLPAPAPAPAPGPLPEMDPTAASLPEQAPALPEALLLEPLL